jgi:hypothetical protein
VLVWGDPRRDNPRQLRARSEARFAAWRKDKRSRYGDFAGVGEGVLLSWTTPVVWRIAARVALGLLLLADLTAVASILLAHGPASEYELYRAAVARGGDVFEIVGYRWSPLALFPLTVVVAIGLPAWQLLHFAALAALRDWRLIALVLIAFPFWDGVRLGGVFTFIAIAAIAAYRGSLTGAVIYFALFLLMPRPLMVPLALWLLWKHPGWRWPVLAAGFTELAVLAVTGTLAPWIYVLAVTGAEEMANPTNIGPSAIIGASWTLIGVPLAGWLLVRGRLGLASLAASPYWLPYYLLFGLLEFVGRPGDRLWDGSVRPAG